MAVHCSWELKKNILLNFSLLSLIFFFFLSFSLSLWLLFFLPFSFTFFFLSPIYSLLRQSVLGLSSSSIFIFITHVAIPRCRPISPSPLSHCSPNADKPSPPSQHRSKLHCRPKLHRRSKLHQHRLHQTQEHRGFRGCGWISWVSLGIWWRFGWVLWWLSFVVQWWCGCVGGDLCGGFWLIWIFGSGCGWLFMAC